MTEKQKRKLTLKKFAERERFMINYLKEYKVSLKYLRKVNAAIVKGGRFFDEVIGYCGGGNSGCKNESLSSKLVPDPDSKNWSCYYHDELEELRILTKDCLLTDLEVEMFFEASCKFDEDGIIDEIETPIYVFFATTALKIRSWFA